MFLFISGKCVCCLNFVKNAGNSFRPSAHIQAKSKMLLYVIYEAKSKKQQCELSTLVCPHVGFLYLRKAFAFLVGACTVFMASRPMDFRRLASPFPDPKTIDWFVDRRLGVNLVDGSEALEGLGSYGRLHVSLSSFGLAY